MTAIPDQMRISVLGTGDVGSTLIELLGGAGYLVRVGSRRGVDRLSGTVRAAVLSGRAELRPVSQSAVGADVVILAVPWVAALRTLAEAAPAPGTIAVDATNYNEGRDGAQLDPGPGGTTEVLAARYPTLRWVKSFNMLWTGYLREDADRADPHIVVLVAADDSDAKLTVAEIIRDTGFVPFDTGSLGDARERQLEGTPAWNQRLAPDQATTLLSGAPGVIRDHRSAR